MLAEPIVCPRCQAQIPLNSYLPERRDLICPVCQASVAPPVRAPLSNAFTPEVDTWYDLANAFHWDIVTPALLFLALTAGLLLLCWQFALLGVPLFLLLWPPLHLGLVAIALNLVQHRGASSLELFRGFCWPGSAYGTHLIAGLILGPLVGVPLYLLWQVHAANDRELLVPGVALLLIGVGPAIYLMLRCFFFALPLVVERNAGPLEAVRGSWIMTRGHVGQLLIPVMGLIVPGLVLIFSIPYVFLVLAAAYVHSSWQLQSQGVSLAAGPGLLAQAGPAPGPESCDKLLKKPPSRA